MLHCKRLCLVIGTKLFYFRFVRLNGELLKLGENLKLPDFKPNLVERNEILELSPYSIVFWVFTNTNLEACKP